MLGVNIDVHQKNPSAFVGHMSIPSVCMPPPGRLQPRQHAHPGKPSVYLVQRDTSPRITGERARFRGRLVRDAARHGCRLSACSVSLTRSAVPGGTRHLLHGNHPERRDERLVAMGRLSYAWIPHTTLGVCSTPPRASLGPLLGPLPSSLLHSAPGREERGSPAIPACMQLQPRRPTMDIAVAQQFLVLIR